MSRNAKFGNITEFKEENLQVVLREV